MRDAVGLFVSPFIPRTGLFGFECIYAYRLSNLYEMQSAYAVLLIGTEIKQEHTFSHDVYR